MTDEELKELENLRWQVANWERKEINEASCCMANEAEVKRLRSAMAEAQAQVSREYGEAAGRLLRAALEAK